MNSADIEPTASPEEKRCTAHLFFSGDPEGFVGPTIHSGSRVRMPNTADNWPPDILFDAMYANAVLHRFAPQKLQEKLEQWKATFYPRDTSTAQANYQAIIDERATQNEKRNKQNHAHEQHAANRANRAGDDDGDYFDLLMMLLYILIPQDKVEAARREAEENKAEMRRSQLADKVGSWAQGVADACL